MPPKTKKDRVRVVSPSGEVGTVPANLAKRALSEGYKPATAEDIRLHERKKTHGGVGGQAVSAIAGAGRTLSMGGTDWAAVKAAEALEGEAGAAEMQQMLRDLQEENPSATLAGEVGGLVGGIAGSMGKVAKAGALRGAAAMTPGAAVMRGGAALEGALMKAGAGRGLAMGARAGAEGAAFGVGHLLSESALGNTELTGEALFASMGEGALWGAGTAGALYGTGRLIGGAAKRGKSALQSALNRGSKEASEAATERMFGHGTPALDDIARFEAAHDGNVKLMATSRKPGAAAWRKYTLEEAIPKRDKLVRSMVETGNSLEDDVGRLHKDHTQSGKPDTFGHLVSETPEARVAAEKGSRSLLVESEGMLEEMATDVISYGGEFGPNTKFIRNARNLQRGVQEAIDSGAPLRTLRTRVEGLKRYLDNNVVSFANSSSPKGKAFLTAGANRIKGVANNYRTFLESEAAWGGAGRLQKPMNAAIHEDIGSSKYLNRKIKTRAGIDPNNPYRERTVFDPERVDPWARNLTNPKGDLARQELTKQLNARAAAAEAILEHGKPTADQVKYLTRIRDNSRGLLKEIDETAEQVSRLAQLEELARQEATEITIAGEFGGKVLGALKGAAGMATGGSALGAAETAGAALGGGTMGRARKMLAIETLSQRLRGKMDGPLGKLFGKAGKAAADAAGGVPITGARAAQYFAGEADRKRTAKNRREEYRERSEWVRARNEQQASDDVKETAAAVSDAAPNATVAAANTAARAQAYLASQLPRDGVPGSAMGPPPEASAMEVDSWLRKLKAVEDPSSILDDLTDGKLSRDSVEAVKAVYPALYEQMRGDVMTRINDMQAEGKQLPYRERIDLGTLLDIPTDPMLRPDVMATIQASYEQQNEPQATPEKKVPDLAGAYETESEQTEKDT